MLIINSDSSVILCVEFLLAVELARLVSKPSVFRGYRSMMSFFVPDYCFYIEWCIFSRSALISSVPFSLDCTLRSAISDVFFLTQIATF